MLPEVDRFGKWLRRKNPPATTHRHYANDLKLFFAWAGKPPGAITLLDMDAYIEHCQGLGHAVATINRRLAALSSFYQFLALEADDAPPNPILPRRHFIRQGTPAAPLTSRTTTWTGCSPSSRLPATGPCSC